MSTQIAQSLKAPSSFAGYNTPMLTGFAVAIFFFITTAATAQYGTAPNNYPDKYNGSTLTGTVAETEDDEITLKYTKADKTDTFIGRLETACSSLA